MKIHKPIGSTERLREMFQGVNKMNLNENALGVVNPVEAAFDDLVANNMNIEQVNNQVNGDESIVEIAGIDKNGTDVVFKFAVQSQATDQEGVNQIQDVRMISAVIGGNSYDDDGGIATINANRKRDLFDAVSEFVEFESDTDTVSDEMYEDAVKFIDRVPYKKGTEQIQTSKAYGDEKPTNPDLRVKAPELDQFVTEIQDYVPDEEIEQDPTALPDMGDIAIPDDGTTGVDPYDQQPDFSGEPEVSPEKAAMINQVYDSLVQAGNPSPTSDDVMREIANLQGNVQPVEKTRAIPRGAEAFWESEEDYPKQLGKKFKPKRQIPKKKKKPQSVVKLSEEDAEVLDVEKENPDLYPPGWKEMDGHMGPNAPKSIDVGWADQEPGNVLQGGLGDDKELSQFCPIQVAKGIKVEMEHTDNPLIAVEIVMDHLVEDPHYYGKGDEDPEAAAMAGAQVDVEKQEDDEVRDELLGFKALNVGDEVDENEYGDRERAYWDINSENIEIKINGYPWYGKKIDSTHLLLSNTFENIEKSIPWNIDQFRGKSYYDDLKSWLHNEGNPSGNEYEDIMETVIKDDKGVSHINKENGIEEPVDPEIGHGDYLKQSGQMKSFDIDKKKHPLAGVLDEEDGFTEYMGDVGDRYRDANDNEFTVRNKVKGGVTLQGQAGEKEVATSDLLFLKKK